MDSYRFLLKDYHAIAHADIAIDGITVLAGENGCGKSTIARWLHAYVNISNDFDDLIDRELLENINGLIDRMARIARNLILFETDAIKGLRRLPKSFFQSVNGRRHSLSSDEDDDYQRLLEQFEAKVTTMCDMLRRQSGPSPSGRLVASWIAKSLGYEGNENADFISEYQDRQLEKAHKYVDDALGKKEEYGILDLTQLISSELDLSDTPRNFNLSENGLALMADHRFRPPLNLVNSVYVDTPMALSSTPTFDNAVWNRFRTAMIEPRGEMPATAFKTAARLRKVMGGDIQLRNDDLSGRKEIRYIRQEDGLDIPVHEAATGLKTFAYMLRLLENGYLTEHSLLLIDEPEAHLHPQWVVEFARLLVLLNKEVGTKIVVASHNPDMIAAIKTISEAENRSETTRFYQAERDADTLRYRFVDLGNDITEIFRSFNIAIERIDTYGA